MYATNPLIAQFEQNLALRKIAGVIQTSNELKVDLVNHRYIVQEKIIPRYIDVTFYRDSSGVSIKLHDQDITVTLNCSYGDDPTKIVDTLFRATVVDIIVHTTVEPRRSMANRPSLWVDAVTSAITTEAWKKWPQID